MDQISEAATLDDEVTEVLVVIVDMMDALQGKCEQRYKECEKISLKETYDQVEKHQI